ncbi:hypothetical protein LP418_01590 [Nocardioides sp. B-3]|nr:hypothetical protein [Nocardioides sp. B-3]UUZ61867.1 hypothetical protein LP418_01590 [Nocardioides sp. B-3]
MPGPVLSEHWPLSPEGQRVLDTAMSKGRITRRGVTRVHRVALSVADPAGRDRPGVEDVETALALRTGGAVDLRAMELVPELAS